MHKEKGVYNAEAFEANGDGKDSKRRFHQKIEYKRFGELKPGFRNINSRLKKEIMCDGPGPVRSAVETSKKVQQALPESWVRFRQNNLDQFAH